MKKARAEKTVKLHRKTWGKGTVFSAPYPKGVQREIDEDTGTVVEFEVPDNDRKTPVSVQVTATETMMEADSGGDQVVEETDAERKLRLEKYALEKFGFKIDRRKSLESIEALIADLEAQAETEVGDTTENSTSEPTNDETT